MEEFMSQAVEATHTATVAEAGTHDTHRTIGGLRALVPLALLMTAGLIMTAASVYVFLGEKKINVSPSLWMAALDLCRVVTGLYGIFAIVSVVTERRSGSRGGNTFGSVVCGAALIAAAVAGLGLVMVITGLGGITLLFAGGFVVVEALRVSHPEPRRTLGLRRGVSRS
jgi:hypothetical protein